MSLNNNSTEHTLSHITIYSTLNWLRDYWKNMCIRHVCRRLSLSVSAGGGLKPWVMCHDCVCIVPSMHWTTESHCHLRNSFLMPLIYIRIIKIYKNKGGAYKILLKHIAQRRTVAHRILHMENSCQYKAFECVRVCVYVWSAARCWL